MPQPGRLSQRARPRPRLPAAALVSALEALRASLRALGSDLVVRVGPIDPTVAEFCAAAGVDTVLTEREVEARWAAVAGGSRL